jgi:hypothetical protein
MSNQAEGRQLIVGARQGHLKDRYGFHLARSTVVGQPR